MLVLAAMMKGRNITLRCKEVLSGISHHEYDLFAAVSGLKWLPSAL
jgi:hypothetical protein